MKRFVRVICLLFCFAPAGAAQHSSVPAGDGFRQEVPVAARSLFERALRMAKAGKGELAQTLLKESLKLYPEYFDAHLALGNELSKAGRLSEAMTEFESARRINPRDDQVYLSVGLVMMQQKRYDLAASVFADASLLNRTEPLHRLMRGIALVRQASALKQSASRGALAEQNSLYRKAEEALSEAYDLSSGRLAEVYLYRALIYEQRGERERAATELERYLQQSSGAENADAIREAIRKLREPLSGRGAAQRSPRREHRQ